MDKKKLVTVSRGIRADSFLESMRRAEIERLREWFCPSMNVLELGGKTGFQAAILASWGCSVTSLDIDIAPLPDKAYYPVRKYDGMHIPAKDASFDVTYSSHMLYWVLHRSDFFVEMRRVLRADGLGIHILPSPVWRTLTCLTHYPFLALKVGQLLIAKAMGRDHRRAKGAKPTSVQGHNSELISQAKSLILPSSLGPAASPLSEWKQWRRKRMVRLFKKQGFETLAVIPLRLLYSGHHLCGSKLPLSVRHLLSFLWGSSSTAFVTRKTSLVGTSK